MKTSGDKIVNMMGLSLISAFIVFLIKISGVRQPGDIILDISIFLVRLGFRFIPIPGMPAVKLPNLSFNEVLGYAMFVLALFTSFMYSFAHAIDFMSKFKRVKTQQEFLDSLPRKDT
jgi:hypothetical protein